VEGPREPVRSDVGHSRGDVGLFFAEIVVELVETAEYVSNQAELDSRLVDPGGVKCLHVRRCDETQRLIVRELIWR
jgi:hypothetical protein